MIETSALVESIVQSAPHGIVVLESDLRIVFWNGVLADWVGVDESEAVGEIVTSILPEFSRARYALRLEGLLRHGTPVVLHGSMNEGLLSADGRTPCLTHYRITCHRVDGETGPRIVLWVENTSLLDETVGYLQEEIAARRRAEAEVESAARSQEVLYRELQHRVKNSLSLISSLVSLSQYSAGEERADDALAEIGARIDSIALVYNQLAARSRYGELELSDYLRELIDSIMSALASPPGMDVPEITLGSCVVPVDTAVSLGLIVNELITNSIKHAFPGSREGRIFVRLTAKEAEFELEVSDDGVGKSRGRESEPVSHGLGLGIVDLLVEQIGAELEACEAPGVGYRIRLRQEPLPSLASD